MEPNVLKGRSTQRAVAGTGAVPAGHKRKKSPVPSTTVVARKSTPVLADDDSSDTPKKISKKDGTYSRVMQVNISNHVLRIQNK